MKRESLLVNILTQVQESSVFMAFDLRPSGQWF